MADSADPGPLPTIAALPPTTVRQIGSSQVLVDPSSVVKELIDNALDARATAIFVDITANTIDSIQVKDSGHGIPQEDRPLVCRRHCTSKIRDFHDLKEVGGKWLGFRGESMASIAEIGGTLEVTTRVEGEPVAVRLKYGRSGELTSTERASAPVGTTVKATEFFKTLPVRKQSALKNSAKCLAKIRRLIQAYALARPAVRFSLRVLKAKSNKGDFMYAPKKDANVEDAALKIIGKDCALQCDWTAMEADGFEIRAFLPKPTAIGSKIANEGAFIAVDFRPMSTTRGTPKKIVAIFKERLRKSNPSLGSVKDPFFCMNIICPPDSYDPNIEPAKDNVLFENGDMVIDTVDKLLISYYPEGAVAVDEIEEEVETPTSTQPIHEPNEVGSPSQSQAPVAIYEDSMAEGNAEPTRRSEAPLWRSSMYGIDEEDLELMSENQPPVIEEEEGRRAADVSNPWTIARMNAGIKPKKPVDNLQLLTPAKGSGDVMMRSSSPIPMTLRRQQLPVEPLTPQTASRKNIAQSSLDEELLRSIQHVSSPYTQRTHARNLSHSSAGEGTALPLGTRQTSVQSGNGRLDSSSPPPIQPNGSLMDAQVPGILLPNISAPSPAPRRSRRNQSHPQLRRSSPYPPEAPQQNDRWFGQPMRGGRAPKAPRPRNPKRHADRDAPLFPLHQASRLRGTVMDEADRLEGNRLSSKNNTDIRDFFGRNRDQHQRSVFNEPSFFTPINWPPQGFRNGLSLLSHERPPENFSRATSAEPQPRSRYVRDQVMHRPGRAASLEPSDITDQLRAYAERETPPEHSSAAQCAEPSLVTLQANKTPGNRPKSNATTEKLHANAGREDPSYISPASRTRCNSRRDPPPHDLASKLRSSSKRRRRTATGPNRTVSSGLLLEHVPQGHHIQDLVLPVHAAVKDVVHSMRKLDMRMNSLEWGYPAGDEAYDVLGGPITDSILRGWLGVVCAMLDEWYERERGVDVVGVLEDGIVKGLHRMNDARDKKTADINAEELRLVEEWTKQVAAASELDAITERREEQEKTDNATQEVLPQAFETDFDDDEMLMDF